MQKLRYKYYNKRITTHGNFQFYDQEENNLNRTFNANSGAHTLTHGNVLKSPFNKINVATIKSKQNSNK